MKEGAGLGRFVGQMHHASGTTPKFRPQPTSKLMSVHSMLPVSMKRDPTQWQLSDFTIEEKMYEVSRLAIRHCHDSRFMCIGSQRADDSEIVGAVCTCLERVSASADNQALLVCKQPYTLYLVH